MATKQYAAKVTIGGAVEASFKNAFGSASDAIKKLGAEVKALSRQRADIRAFGESSAKIDKFRASLDAANAELAQARQNLANAATPTSKLTRAVDAAERKVKGLEQSLEAENATLAKLKGKLEQAGISTNSLERADAKLEARIRRITTAMRNQERATERFANARGKLAGWMGAGVTVGAAAASFIPAVRAAGDFQDAMVDVGKFVDDANTPEKLAQLGDAIRDIGRNSPLGAQGVAKLVAEAGKIGLLSEEALKFAKASEVMAVGLEMTADEAGEIITRIKTGMGISIDEVVDLGDAINYLADKTAASSKGITEIVQRQGGTLRATTKLTNAEIAALASALEPVSPNAETAATAMKNMTKALTMGEFATKRQKAAFKALGMESTAVSLGMQKDATGTITSVLEAVRKLPDEQRGSIITALFGDESKGPIASLVANSENLANAFAMVADKQAFLGRSQREYQRELGKFSNQWAVLKNQIGDLGIEIGTALLPVVTDLFKSIGKGVKAVSLWAKENPKLFRTIVIGTAAVVGLTAAVVAVGIAFAAVNVAITGFSAAWAGVGVIAAAAGVSVGGLIAIFVGVGAAVVAAALVIRKYWEPIKAFFEGLWQGIKDGWEAAGGPELWAEASTAIGDAAKEIMGWLEPVTGDFGELFEAGRKAGEFIGITLVGLLQLVLDPIETLKVIVGQLGEAFRAAFQMIKDAAEPVLNWLVEKLNWITEKIGAAIESLKAIGNALPSWMGGGGGDAQALPNKTSFVPPAMRGEGNRQINVNVQGAPGQSEEALAAAVIRRIKAERDLLDRGNLNDMAFA